MTYQTASSPAAPSVRLVSLALGTALATATLSGCATGHVPPAAMSASKAEAALAKGQTESAVDHAEAAVKADPRNAAYRATLGAAYLDAGRFSSAATSFDDAMSLGDSSPRTALSLALALAADGKQREAVAVLDNWKDKLPGADLGLAYSLAGQPQRGVAILSATLRGGENTAKVRQNLAYSYALAGQWREARVMAAQDIPADKVSDRIAEWAEQANPLAYRERVATLLAVPVNAVDGGQPAQLALANTPSADQLAAEAAGQAPAVAAAQPQAILPAAAPAIAPAATPVAQAELPPIGDPVDGSGSFASVAQAPKMPATIAAAYTPAAAPAMPARAAASSGWVEQDGTRFVSRPVVQPVPATERSVAVAAPRAGRVATPRAERAIAAADSSAGSHLIQLGSFSSEAGARRAWNIYVGRYPELSGHDMVITQAVVNGKNYWRVSAAGYNAQSSRSMCGRVNSTSNDGCFAYAEGRPLPGAVDTGRRFAMR